MSKKTKNEKIRAGSVEAAPAKGLRGEIQVPGDKSISHRAVFFGSISEGTTEVEGFLEGEDNLSTIGAFRAMGIDIEHTPGGTVKIHGKGPNGLSEPLDVIDAGNSGTTARLLTGVLSAQPFFSVITGDSSLRTRPMKRVVEPLSMMGAAISGRYGNSLLPLAISGKKLAGIEYRTPVASAQLKSAILLAGLYADGETVVIEPQKSRDHTERMLSYLGAGIRVEGNSVRVKKAKTLRGGHIAVPGDISSAAFFMVGAMITPDSELIINNVGINPTRTGIINILSKMGGDVKTLNATDACGEPVARILVKSSVLKGIEIPADVLLPAIDEFPIICIAAAYAAGTTTISGAKELRVKESDRIAVMAQTLDLLGIKNTEKEDGIIIEGIARGSVAGGVTVDSRGDHRIAMSAAIAALRARRGVSITGARSVDVSFPGFFQALEGVRVA